MEAIKQIQPQPDCFCTACRALRERAELERGALVLAAWQQRAEQEPGTVIQFGKAAQ